METVESFDRVATQTVGRRTSRLKQVLAATGFSSATEPDSALSAYLANARLLQVNGDYHWASHLYRAVLHQHPESCFAIRGMAECAVHLGHTDEAMKCYQALSLLDPQAPDLLAYGNLLAGVGRDADALWAYHEALLLLDHETPILFEIYKNAGNAYARLGDLDAAEEFYNRAFSLNPCSDVLLVNYGSLDIQKSDFNRGLEHFRGAVECNQKNEQAWIGLALIHREFGDLELSWGNLERTLDINPTNRMALRLMAEGAARANRLPDAIRRIIGCLDKVGHEAELGFFLAQLYFLAGNISAAQGEIEKVVAWGEPLEGLGQFIRALQVAKGEIK